MFKINSMSQAPWLGQCEGQWDSLLSGARRVKITEDQVLVRGVAPEHAVVVIRV